MEEESIKYDGFKHKGFKLISLELKGSKLFKDIKYDFIDKKRKQDKIYTTVLIGQNGTLKSRLFQKIIQLFWSLNDLKNNRKVTISEKFDLVYSINHTIIHFTNFKQKGKVFISDPQPYLIINGEETNDFTRAELPLSIIATAIMLTDRFPFPDQEKFKQYKYLGSRYRPQLASSKTFINRVVEFVSSNINSEAFIVGVRKIVKEFLNASVQPNITFYTQNTPKFFKGKMSVEKFFSYFENMDEIYKTKNTSPPFKLNHYKSKIRNNPELSQRIVSFCNNLKENKVLRDFNGKSAKAISYNLLDENDISRLREEFVLLDHMRQLGIIYPAEIELLIIKKENGKTESYSIFETSSGEHNILGSMIGIIATIQTNSIVFIDEPEISLHPNWQMKYLTFLNELLSHPEYATCHLFVATHSHFLVSDLDGHNSSVISLTRDSDTNELSAELLKGTNTFGWAAEEVLLKVFKVVTTRNYYVAEKLGLILDFIANEKSTTESIKAKFFELELDKISGLTNEDPLKTVYETIKREYVS